MTQDFLIGAMHQKSKLSTEAGTRGQVRASLWGYGFIGMFRDEGPGALVYRHCGREMANMYSTEKSWVLQGWMLSLMSC